MKKPRPISRPVRELAGLVRQYAVVEDATPDLGSSSAEQVRSWLEQFLATVEPGSEPRRSWERADEATRAAVWTHWERLRGKSIAQRAQESAERHNARIRQKYPLFADDPELLRSIRVAYHDPEEEAQKWLADNLKRFEDAQALRAQGLPVFERRGLRETCHEKLMAKADDWDDSDRLPLNAAKVWGRLMCYGAPPQIGQARALALELWPDLKTRQDHLARIHAHRAVILEKYREEARQVATGELTDRPQRAESRTRYFAAWEALEYLISDMVE